MQVILGFVSGCLGDILMFLGFFLSERACTAKKMLACLLCQFTHDIPITGQKNNSVSGCEALPQAVTAVGRFTQLFAWAIKNVLSN